MKEIKEYIIKIENFIKKNKIDIEIEENNNNNNIQEQFGVQLDVIKLTNNKEFLQKREKELTEINKLSQKIKVVSDTMKTNVYNQGEELTGIQAKVNEMDSNVDKAGKEIEKAKNMDKKTNKKLCFIFILILILIIGFIVFLVKIIT
jgi:t-SNARE complex subunit (syntaxin)